MKFAFIHADLVLGGAEKLILDMAKVLSKKEENEITIYTNTKQINNNFEISEKIKIKKILSFLPKTFLNKFKAIFSYIRILLMTLYIILFEKKYDVYILDQISFPLIILKLFRKKTIFYCHYPDFLQDDKKEKGVLKKIYRFFIFFLEYVSMKFSDLILCNSQFTKKVTIESFHLKQDKIKILYPSCEINNNLISSKKRSRDYFLALNRIESKKNHLFIISVFENLLKKSKKGKIPNLIIAGGLNTNSKKDKDYYLKLQKKIKELNLTQKIKIKINITDKEKINLIYNSMVLLYPPKNEHFGIVPIEGMSLGVPCIANFTGGPLETVLNGKTGFLVDNQIKDWVKVLEFYIGLEMEGWKNVEVDCRERFKRFFGFEGFERCWLEILEDFFGN